MREPSFSAAFRIFQDIIKIQAVLLLLFFPLHDFILCRNAKPARNVWMSTKISNFPIGLDKGFLYNILYSVAVRNHTADISFDIVIFGTIELLEEFPVSLHLPVSSFL